MLLPAKILFAYLLPEICSAAILFTPALLSQEDIACMLKVLLLIIIFLLFCIFTFYF